MIDLRNTISLDPNKRYIKENKQYENMKNTVQWLAWIILLSIFNVAKYLLSYVFYVFVCVCLCSMLFLYPIRLSTRIKCPIRILFVRRFLLNLTITEILFILFSWHPGTMLFVHRLGWMNLKLDSRWAQCCKCTAPNQWTTKIVLGCYTQITINHVICTFVCVCVYVVFMCVELCSF